MDLKGANKGARLPKSYIKFGKMIAEIRNALGENQLAFARRFKTTANTVSRWEAGIYKPSYEVIAFVINFIGLPKPVRCPTCKGCGRIIPD